MAQAIRIPAEPKQSAAPDKPGPLPSERPSKILVEDRAPVIGGGRYRVKRCVDDSVAVSAAIFRSGHDLLGAAVRYRPAEPGGRWREAPLVPRGEDSWSGAFTVSKIGYWSWQV